MAAGHARHNTRTVLDMTQKGPEDMMKTYSVRFDGKDALAVVDGLSGAYIRDGKIVHAWAPTGAPAMSMDRAAEIIATVEAARDAAAVERCEMFAAAEKAAKEILGPDAFILRAISAEHGVIEKEKALLLRTTAVFNTFDVGGVRNEKAGESRTYSIVYERGEFQLQTWLKL